MIAVRLLLALAWVRLAIPRWVERLDRAIEQSDRELEELERQDEDERGDR